MVRRRTLWDQISIRQVALFGFFALMFGFFLNKANLEKTNSVQFMNTESHDDYVIHTPWGNHDIVIHQYPPWRNMKIFKHLDTVTIKEVSKGSGYFSAKESGYIDI